MIQLIQYVIKYCASMNIYFQITIPTVKSTKIDIKCTGILMKCVTSCNFFKVRTIT